MHVSAALESLLNGSSRRGSTTTQTQSNSQTGSGKLNKSKSTSPPSTGSSGAARLASSRSTSPRPRSSGATLSGGQQWASASNSGKILPPPPPQSMFAPSRSSHELPMGALGAVGPQQPVPSHAQLTAQLRSSNAAAASSHQAIAQEQRVSPTHRQGEFAMPARPLSRPSLPPPDLGIGSSSAASAASAAALSAFQHAPMPGSAISSGSYYGPDPLAFVSFAAPSAASSAPITAAGAPMRPPSSMSSARERNQSGPFSPRARQGSLASSTSSSAPSPAAIARQQQIHPLSSSAPSPSSPHQQYSWPSPQAQSFTGPNSPATQSTSSFYHQQMAQQQHAQLPHQQRQYLPPSQHQNLPGRSSNLSSRQLSASDLTMQAADVRRQHASSLTGAAIARVASPHASPAQHGMQVPDQSIDLSATASMLGGPPDSSFLPFNPQPMPPTAATTFGAASSDAGGPDELAPFNFDFPSFAAYGYDPNVALDPSATAGQQQQQQATSPATSMHSPMDTVGDHGTEAGRATQTYRFGATGHAAPRASFALSSLYPDSDSTLAASAAASPFSGLASFAGPPPGADLSSGAGAVGAGATNGLGVGAPGAGTPSLSSMWTDSLADLPHSRDDPAGSDQPDPKRPRKW